ncbi:MAG TPA: 3-hydroxylacyl-ACP dehydratase [Rhodocyclaceae bacterium]|nr:3-hydroxylacyl-ACP dehydratase [Rhodocyclaceae bacterium]
MQSELLDHDWIAARIPHAGSMCLLDGVQSWDDQHIVCVASNHRASSNPLRNKSRLGSVTGIEYAAQTMAVHGALLTGKDGSDKPRAGFLAIVRDVSWHVDNLDDQVGVLYIYANRISGDDMTILYAFDIRCADVLLMSGRAAVALATGDIMT